MTVNIAPVVAWTIYGIGVVLFPIIVGFLFKGKKFDVMDDGVPIFFGSLFWPLVIFIISMCWCVMVVCFIPGWIWNCLLHFGGWAGNRYEEWRENTARKEKERKEREHAKRVLNAKPGDKEYFDYVCD